MKDVWEKNAANSRRHNREIAVVLNQTFTSKSVYVSTRFFRHFCFIFFSKHGHNVYTRLMVSKQRDKNIIDCISAHFAGFSAEENYRNFQTQSHSYLKVCLLNVGCRFSSYRQFWFGNFSCRRLLMRVRRDEAERVRDRDRRWGSVLVAQSTPAPRPPCYFRRLPAAFRYQKKLQIREW